MGVNVKHNINDNIIKLYQRKYSLDLLKRFEMDNCKSVVTSIDANIKLIKNKDKINEQILFKYQQIIGSFHYLVTCTRPDLAIVTCILSQFVQNPSTEHFTAAKRVLRYMKGTQDY